MSHSGSYGKSLKGSATLSAKVAQSLQDSLIANLASGAVSFNNVNITAGIIDGVTLGVNEPGPVYTTILQAGNPEGGGYDVSFYGQTVGDSVIWDSTTGTWNIQGDLVVRDIADLGNIRIEGNNIKAINTNGFVNIFPKGSGKITLNGPVQQNTTVGDITFQTSSGLYSVNVSDDVTTSSSSGVITSTSYGDTSIISNNADVNITSGASSTVTTITNITVGVDPILTTSVPHVLNTGDTIVLSGTNSTPNLNGIRVVNAIVSSTRFTLSNPVTTTSSGNTGSFVLYSNINLLPANNVTLPVDKALVFGGSTQTISGNSSNEININASEGINLNVDNGSHINILDGTGIAFGDSSRVISSDGVNLLLASPSTMINSDTTTISGNLIVNGDTLNIHPVHVTIDDIILTLGGGSPLVIDDNKDRGIEYRWFKDGVSKLGFFGFDRSTERFSFYKDAVNNNEVISGTLGDIDVGTVYSNNVVLSGSLSSSNLILTGTTSITLNTPTVNVSQGTILSLGTASIYQDPLPGCDLHIDAHCNLLLTPGGTTYNVILPVDSGIVLSGKNGTQFIEAKTSSTTTIGSDSYINFVQNTGGVRLTQNLPLIFNAAETSKITGNVAGDLTFNSANDINLNPAIGNVNVPVLKSIQFGTTTESITGSGTSLNIVSGGTLQGISSGDLTFTSTAGNIFLSPSSKVTIPLNKKIVFGNVTENITSSSSGVIDVNANTTINVNAGNLIVNSGTSTFNSTTVTILDPIPTLGQSLTNDNKDRGISYQWNNLTSKLGFFGYDSSAGLFTFIPDAVITGEIVSGLPGNARFAGLTVDSFVTTSETVTNLETSNIFSTGILSLAGATSIFLNTPVVNVTQGTILSLGTASIYQDPLPGCDLHIDAHCNLLLTPGGTTYNVILPVDSGLVLSGKNGTQFIESKTSSTTTIGSDSYINFVQTSGGIRLTQGLPLIFNTAETSKITGTSDGDLSIVANASINVLGTRVFVPSGMPIQFGSTTEFVSGTGSTISISSSSLVSLVSSGNINLTPTGSVVLPANRKILFGSSTEYASSDTLGSLFLNAINNINLNSININLTCSGSVILPVNKRILLGAATEYIGSDSSGNIVSNTSGNYTLTTASNINLSPTGSVILPVNKKILFGNATEYIGSDIFSNITLNANASITLSSLSNIALISSSGKISLTPSSFVELPSGKPMRFGSSTETITGSGNNLNLTASSAVNVTSTSSNIFLTPNQSVVLPIGKSIQLGNNTEYLGSDVSGNLTLASNFSLILSSLDVSIADPIITLAQNAVSDLKDRGIAYKYKSGSTAKVGWFGWDQSANEFTFIPTAVISNEIVSGAAGKARFGDTTIVGDLNVTGTINGTTGSGGGGGSSELVTVSVVLVSTDWTELVAEGEGDFIISVRNGVVDGPCAKFFIAKNSTSAGASCVRANSCAGITTHERIELRWLANSSMEIRKTGDNYDGSYTVKYIANI